MDCEIRYLQCISDFLKGGVATPSTLPLNPPLLVVPQYNLEWSVHMRKFSRQPNFLGSAFSKD